MRVPPDASATRERLLDAAAHEFAEHGVWNASLIEVTRRAGQRNRAALRYHFGSREAVLCAVLERHVEFLAHREGELLAKALHHARRRRRRGGRGHRPPRGRAGRQRMAGPSCLLIIAELAGEDPARLSPELESVLARTGGHEVYALLEARMPRVPPASSTSASASSPRSSSAPSPTGHGRSSAGATRPGRSSTTRPSWRTWWPWSRRRSRPGPLPPARLDISTGG